MPKNTIDDLRNHLFATMEALQDEENPMEISRARAICEVADRLIDTAKVEVEMLDVVGQIGQSGSAFLKLAAAENEPAAQSRPALMPKRVV